jgi:hypothetical protein
MVYYLKIMVFAIAHCICPKRYQCNITRLVLVDCCLILDLYNDKACIPKQVLG